MKEDEKETEVGPFLRDRRDGLRARWPPESESSGGTGFYRNTPAIADKESFRRLITWFAAPPRSARDNPPVEPRERAIKDPVEYLRMKTLPMKKRRTSRERSMRAGFEKRALRKPEINRSNAASLVDRFAPSNFESHVR